MRYCIEIIQLRTDGGELLTRAVRQKLKLASDYYGKSIPTLAREIHPIVGIMKNLLLSGFKK